MPLTELEQKLHLAIWEDDLEGVVAALDAGADPNAINPRGNTPLASAAIERRTAIAEVLIEQGADPSGRGSDGSPLEWAVFRSNARMAHRLLEAGAKVSWRDLQNACERHVPSVAEALLDLGVDVNGSTEDGGTALMSAAFVGDALATDLLLKRGADVNARTRTGWAALLSAAAKGHSAVVRMLLNAGADITAGDKDGDTALRLAVEAGHSEVVQILRDAGAQA